MYNALCYSAAGWWIMNKTPIGDFEPEHTGSTDKMKPSLLGLLKKLKEEQELVAPNSQRYGNGIEAGHEWSAYHTLLSELILPTEKLLDFLEEDERLRAEEITTKP